ncbi:uncharacterized protein A4U43_C03F19390 [Asparagus officinalis]|uniref:Uncharacterized protein n=1 Tax=Asparagus officinalis TaxID=4686 RepID=A0A5P1FE57_ASPOF|nr:uncharacterized protein A4U43_C03F19390 [Asparagus officinalis]
MVDSLGRNKRIAIYVVHGVEEYTGEVDIDLREGARNEAPNEDNATTYEASPSNANVVNEDDEDNEATTEAQHDDNEATKEAKINDKEGLVDVNVENED